MDYYHQPVQVTSQVSPFMSYEQQSDPSFQDWKERQDQQQVTSGSVSSSTGLEDAMWGLGLQSPSDQEMSPGPYPERPGEQDCPYYMRTGLCAFGMSCRFNHPPNRKLAAAIARGKGEYPERPGQPECQYFLKTGTCKFGSTCKFDHPRDKAGIQSRVQLNIIGLPYRPGEKECAYYMRTGSCKYGVTCKFHHPQPTLFASSPTAAAPAGGSSAGNPSQQPWPIRPFPSPRLQAGASSYTPLLLPSPQGVVSIPGWSTYHEGPHQPPALYIPGSPSAAELGYLPGSPTMGLPPALQPQQKEQALPERPGTTECQYYLKTGECKFGSNCRYHHPRDRAPSSPATLLSPMGLPLRPGVQACSYYVRFGICKFGPTCKFDHPIAAIYGFGSVEYPSPTPPRATLVELASDEQGVSNGSSSPGLSSSSAGASVVVETSSVGVPATSTTTVLLTRKGSSEEPGSGAG